MPFVRKRKTKAGAVSTALVEAYRDYNGRPRQRILASLHGEPDVLHALAKLGFHWAHLREQAQELHGEYQEAKEREWVWKLDAMAKRLLHIDRALKAIERDARVIREHCTAMDEQIDAAIEAYAKRVDRAAMNALAVELYYAQLGEARKEVKPAFRQLLLHYRPRT